MMRVMTPINRARLIAFLVLVTFSALSSGYCFAQGIELTASTGTGILYGVAKEFVYGVHNNQQYTQSELDWDIKPLLIARAALSMRTGSGFAASVSVQLGVPSKTGSISDSDWLNIAYNGDTTKTNYSLQDSYTERAILVDARAGWEQRLPNGATFEPFLSFGFMDFKWTARDGYLQYPPNYIAGSATLPYPDYSTDVVVPISGTGIIYEQTYYIPAAGVEARFRSRDIGGSISFSVSPFVFCNDVDNHILGGYDYYDTMSNGFLLEQKISLGWRIGSSRLSLDVSYRHIGGLRGNTTLVHNGIGYPPGQVASTYTNSAGASYDVLGASLTFDWIP
jgi:outer membrane protease